MSQPFFCSWLVHFQNIFWGQSDPQINTWAWWWMPLTKFFFFTKTPQEQFKNEYISLECLHFLIYLLKVKSHYMWNILHVSHNLCPIRKVSIRNSKCFTVGIISWAIFPQCDLPSHARNHLCRIWKESIKNCTCFSVDTKLIAIF